MTTLLAGTTSKPFTIHTDLLTSRSPYFRSILTPNSHETYRYPTMDEFACALFVRWLYGAALPGPSGFHSLQHYLGLYVLALQFRIEKLHMQVLTQVKVYYRVYKMTASPFRLEYIYAATEGPNQMREFLVGTATERVVCEGRLSSVMKEVLAKRGDFAVDFVQALLQCARNDREGDGRKETEFGYGRDEHVDLKTWGRQVSEG
jgi:hypothetical protein